MSITALSADLSLELRGAVAIVRLTRAAKRNAINDGLVMGLLSLIHI